LNRIKEIREQKQVRQKDLAAAVGISQPYLHDLENCKRGARPDTYKRIAEALGVSVRDLFEDEEKVG